MLFHCFVDGYAVFIAHLVEFVYAHYAAVRKDHCAAFEVELAGLRVSLYGGSETSGGGAFAGGVDCDGGHLFDEFEELRFCGSRITEEEDVDVAS